MVDADGERQNSRGKLPRRHSWSALASAELNDDDAETRTSWDPAAAPSLRQRAAAAAAEPTQQEAPAQLSMQEQLLAATLGVLKMAGGATLSTTGKLAAPPLHVTRTVLLPALWQALCDYVAESTPQRVKDWFRILSSGWSHFFTVIGATEAGKDFREQVVTVGVDIVGCASGDASRQAFMDGMATLVKLSEALHTPETKALLDQLSILACRLVDVAASGRAKKLVCDATEAVWAGLEVFSDPAATLAFAEVTAYLCYALEMEDAIHREGPLTKEQAAKRRHQRNAYQNQAYVQPNMTLDGNSTVEQVILSSLGEASVPEVTCASTSSNPRSTEREDWLRQEAQNAVDGVDWRDGARNEIDLALLQERISSRAAELERQREARKQQSRTTVDEPQQPAPQQPQPQTREEAAATEQEQPPVQSTQRKDDIEDLAVTTVDENGDDENEQDVQQHPVSTEPSQTKKRGIEYADEPDEIGEWLQENPVSVASPVTAVDGESASGRFYRRLDEVMTEKRTEAVSNILNTSWFPKAAAAAGAGNERGQDTIKSRVAAIRKSTPCVSEIGVSRLRHQLGRTAAARDKQTDESRLWSLISLIFGLVALFWFFLGLYGFYAILCSMVGGGRTIMPSATMPQREVIVRVVHVGPDGKIMDVPSSSDDVADYIAKTMK